VAWAATGNVWEREEVNDENVLRSAEHIIYGEREETYGDPGHNLRVIADYWTTYIRSRAVGREAPLDYADVCNMMVLLKVARLGNTPGHRDSLVDLCGYTALQERVRDADSQGKGCTPPAA